MDFLVSAFQFDGGFWSFSLFRLIFLYICKGNIKENQGNNQNPSSNWKEDVRKSVWREIFDSGLLLSQVRYPNIAFPARKRPHAPSPKKEQGVRKKKHAI